MLALLWSPVEDLSGCLREPVVAFCSRLSSSGLKLVFVSLCVTSVHTHIPKVVTVVLFDFKKDSCENETEGLNHCCATTSC